MRIKSHLSFSQYSCFNISKANYIKVYIEGIKFQNKYLGFGKKIADVLESRKPIDDNDRTAIRLLERPEHSELGIRVDFYKIPLYGKLDGYNSKIYEIIEYKTGKNPWTQAKVDKSEQLTFYAIMVSRNFNVKIKDVKIKLDWLETLEDTDGSIILTGRKETFETRRTKLDEIKIYPKIKRAWEGIEELINQYME